MQNGLARARAAIQQASRSHTYMPNEEEGFVPRGSIYINPFAFHQLRINFPFFFYFLVECWLTQLSAFELLQYILGLKKKNLKIMLSFIKILNSRLSYRLFCDF